MLLIHIYTSSIPPPPESSTASSYTSCSTRLYILPLSFQGAPAVVWGGGGDVCCSAACWLIMGRELQLGWPGRVLEPVGLAQGGLATDPGGDGMKSGTSQNTSPGFGAFLAFPPPMAACPCVCVWMSKGGKCVKDAMCVCMSIRIFKQHVCVFYILAVWMAHPSSKTRQHQCRTHPSKSHHDI